MSNGESAATPITAGTLKTAYLSNIKGDLSGAVASAVMALPGNIIYGLMAFAPLGPHYAGHGILAGLFASVFGGFVSAVFGGTPGSIAGPRAPTALVLGSFIGQLLASGAFTNDAATVLTLGFFVVFLSGLIQILFGILRLGGVVKFISYPVIAGIVNGTVIVLLAGAVWGFLGIPKQPGVNLLTQLDQIQVQSVLVALVTMVLWLKAKRIAPWVPGPLLGLLGGTALYYLLQSLGGSMGETLAAVPFAVPAPDYLLGFFALADDSYWRFFPLVITAALTVAILGSVDSLLAVLTLQNLSGQRANGNRELIAQGLGNIANSFFGAIPTAGAAARVSANYQAGGRTRLSGALFGLISLLMVVAFAQYIALIPLAVVAGMTIMTAWIIVDKWSFQLIGHVFNKELVNRREYLWNLAIVVVVAITVVAVDILTAVALGMVTSILIFIIQMSKSIVRNVFHGSKIHSKKQRHVKAMDTLREHGDNIAVVELQGPLFFGATDRLVQEIDTLVKRGVRYIILDFKRVNDADISGATVLMRTYKQLQQKGVALEFSYLHQGDQLWTFLDDLGFLTDAISDHLFPDTDQALESCEDLVLNEVSAKRDHELSRPLEDLLELEDLNDDDRQALHAVVGNQVFSAGDYLCRQGDPGDCIFIIEKGSAEISIKIPGLDRSKRLATLGDGAIFGEMALLDHGKRSADVQAREELRCYQISSAAFAQLKTDRPQIALMILDRLSKILVARLRLANETIGELER